MSGAGVRVKLRLRWSREEVAGASEGGVLSPSRWRAAATGSVEAALGASGGCEAASARARCILARRCERFVAGDALELCRLFLLADGRRFADVEVQLRRLKPASSKFEGLLLPAAIEEEAGLSPGCGGSGGCADHRPGIAFFDGRRRIRLFGLRIQRQQHGRDLPERPDSHETALAACSLGPAGEAPPARGPEARRRQPTRGQGRYLPPRCRSAPSSARMSRCRRWEACPLRTGLKRAQATRHLRDTPQPDRPCQ